MIKKRFTLAALLQGVNVLEQEKLDNMMIEIDGTDNKCKPRSQFISTGLTYMCLLR